MNQPTARTTTSGPLPEVAIVGLGIIGISLGLGLKQTPGQQELSIVGYDKEEAALEQARKVKAVDRTERNLARAVANADLVILDMPWHDLSATLTAIAGHLKRGCIVTDTASVKVPALQAAAEILPSHVHFVGGHPVIAIADASFYKATATLFDKRPYCLAVTPATSAEAAGVVSDLAQRLGAHILYLDPAEHDGIMAGVEALPAIMAAALLGAAREGAWQEAARMAGAQFEASTRLAAEDAAELAALIAGNRQQTQLWLDAFSRHLDSWRSLVMHADQAALENAFSLALAIRGQWQLDRGKVITSADLTPMPEPPSIWMRMLGLGGRQLRGEEGRPRSKD